MSIRGWEVTGVNNRFFEALRGYFPDWYLPDVYWTDIVEIVIVAFLIYQLMVWIKNTKAWMLLKGILVLAVFILVAAILRMNTILWIARNSVSILAIAAIVVFQPELRRALEKLGEKRFLTAIVPLDKGKENDVSAAARSIRSWMHVLLWEKSRPEH